MVDTGVITAFGNTVRVRDLAGFHLILLVGRNAASERWYRCLFRHSTLPIHAKIQHFITERDWSTVAPLLPIQPSQSPAFLVTLDGWIVDWFPAPTLEVITQNPLDVLSPLLRKYSG